MPRYLSLVTEEGDVLVSIQATEREDADGVRLRLFKKLRDKMDWELIEIEKKRALRAQKKK